MPLFRFFLLLLPLLELATLILLGQRIGVGYTLLWVLGSGVLGLVLIQRQGWSMLQQLQIRMAENRSPFAVLKTGMWWLLAGVLLMIPGLITDALALPALAALDDDEVEELFRTLTPITRKVVAAGDIPAATPMGLSRADLDDDSAHLR